MLDLTAIEKPKMPVKISESVTIEVLPASKELTEKMFRMRSGSESGDLYELAAEVLSVNTENKTITKEDLKSLDLFAIKVLFDAYAKFIKGVAADPN